MGHSIRVFNLALTLMAGSRSVADKREGVGNTWSSSRPSSAKSNSTLGTASSVSAEASCILDIDVTSAVLLLYQEKYCPISTSLKPASEHNLDNFRSADKCSNFRSYSCTPGFSVAVHWSEFLQRKDQ